MDLDANRNLIAAAPGRIPGGDRGALQTVYRLTSAKLFGVALRPLLALPRRGNLVCKPMNLQALTPC